MNTKTILMTIALGAGMLAPLAAQETPAPAAVAAARPATPGVEYPRWSRLTPEQAGKDIRAALDRAKAAMDAISRIAPQDATYDNVFRAYDEAGADLNKAEGIMGVLSNTLDSPEVRAVQESLLPELSAFSASITANEQLWGVIKHAAAQPWVQQLSPAQQRLVQQVVDSFRESGADLSPEQKARQAAISARLSRLSMDFGKAVKDSQNAWQYVVEDKAELEGMSDTWLARAAARALAKGYGTAENPQYMVTQDPDSAREVLTKCKVAKTRRAAWEGRQTIGTGQFDTAGMVKEVMELRQELAELLGFKHFADMATAHRMVGSGQAALDFVDGMAGQIRPAFQAEFADIAAVAARETGKPVEKMDPWDIPYYSMVLKKERYNFDPEALRPYLEAESVRRGLFALATRLYGVELTEIPTACLKEGGELPEGTAEVWYPGVRLFQVHDTKSGALLGSLYLDLYPRDSKRPGAWMGPLEYGRAGKDGAPHAPHLAYICANLTKGVDGHPTLYSHQDVRTLFHEFGHALHALLSDTEVLGHSGTSVARDFVELPSQLNENWIWEPESLKTFARHYQTGETIPQELLDKLTASRFYAPATDAMSQLCMAKLDLEMHMHYAEKFAGKDMDAASNALLQGMLHPLTVEPRSMMRQLQHCVCGGYSAGYYSYKWAEVLAADAFTRFAQEGVMNPATGAAYRAAVLSQGDSKPAAEVFRSFMGRAPKPDALLEKQGLLPQGK